MKYQIKKVKQFQLSNGVALTGDLYRDNKLIAYLEDKGNGGGLSIRWTLGHNWQNPEEQSQIIAFYTEHASKDHWTQEYINTENSESLELAVEWMIEMHESKLLAKIGA